MSRVQKDLTIALLVKEIPLAKALSDALREFGVFAHYYHRMDEFWVAANAHTPDLVLVDLASMNDSTMLFRNHPKVKSKEMRFAFTYSLQNRHLMPQTSGLDHYGLINFEMELGPQLDHLIRSLQREKVLEGQNSILTDRVKRLQQRSSHMMHDAKEGHNFQTQVNTLNDIVERIGTKVTLTNFTEMVADVFSEWDACINYGIMQVSNSGQQVMSPEFSRPKFKSMPSLWVNTSCNKGMDDYAQQLVEEVSYDYFGKNIRMIKVCGKWDAPEILIVGGFQDEDLHNFPWDLFESSLSSLYRKALLSKDSEVDKGHLWDIWDTCSYLDDVHFHQVQAGHRVLTLSASGLLKNIKDKHSNRFYWKSFSRDFIGRMSQILEGDFKISCNGVYEILIFLGVDQLEENYRKVRSYTGEFPYWRYFAEPNGVMSTDMAMDIQFLAPSSVNLLRGHTGNFAGIKRNDDSFYENEVR